MQYMLLIYDDEQLWSKMSDEERGSIMGEYFAFTQDLRDKGAMVSGAPLQPTPTATAVRVREGEQLVTDGPFAETKEQLGGYYIVECANLDEAIEAAGKVPSVAIGGSIEVRPLIDM
jgi:hypothetical protein